MNSFFKPLSSRSRAGSGIVETLIAAALASLGITSLCVANANCLGIARAHRELLIADQCLQGRCEQFRTANWRQITDAGGVSAMMNTSPVGVSSQLRDLVETITISTYPPVTPAAAPIISTRDTSGTTTLLSQPPVGFNLRNAAAVRIDIRESWTSAQGARNRIRETSTVVALGGLLH